MLLDREITVPPAGAGPLRVTLPVEGFPPFTLVGFSVSDESVTELEPGGIADPGGFVFALVPPPQEFKLSETRSSPSTPARADL